MLLESVEKDVGTLLNFVNQQQEQLKSMQVKLETLIEQRDIVNATKDVVFGGMKRIKQ